MCHAEAHSRVVTARRGTMKDMAERITELSKWAPGAKAAGALFEMNGYRLPSGSKSGIDGDCAKRVWQKGRATLENAVAVAKACEDPETLRMMLKDRRVAVRTEVLKNPHCPWDVLVAKAAWVSSGKREESHTVRYVARDTMRAAVARVSFKTAYSWLGDDQNIDGYTLVATHAKASDDELMEFMDVRYTLQGDRAWHGWSGVMDRYDLGQRSSELLMKLAKCDPTAANRAARACAEGGKKRISLVWELMDHMHETGNKYAGRSFYSMRRVGAKFHQELHDHLIAHGYSATEHAHMVNPEAPWRIWETAHMSRHGAIDVTGRAISEIWGDDAAVWRLAGEMITEFDGSVTEFVSMLEVFHPLVGSSNV